MMIKSNQSKLNFSHVLLDAAVTALSYVLAWYVIIAVPVVFFTFAGVNTLLPGLHSYG